MFKDSFSMSRLIFLLSLLFSSFLSWSFVGENKIEEIGRNWEAFKAQNETRLKDSNKGVDPITLEQINKLNQRLK